MEGVLVAGELPQDLQRTAEVPLSKVRPSKGTCDEPHLQLR